MQFLDDSLLPETQQPLVIQVAPYGPEFLPSDSDDIPVTMAEQVQKAVDCWNAGATVLHVQRIRAAQALHANGSQARARAQSEVPAGFFLRASARLRTQLTAPRPSVWATPSWTL